jgi:hypothetical protein
MSIHTVIPAGWEADVIEQVSATQQLLGPARARVLVHQEPEHSPFDLEMHVAYSEGRYVVTRLAIIADRTADLENPLRAPHLIGDNDYFSPSESVHPITATGLIEVKLPPLIRKALRPEIRARRQLSNGDWSTGISEEDLVPTTYRLAQLVGDNPTAAVAEELGITRQAAAQRVARARKQGHLPPTRKGAR